jgi:hypothetical protein
VNSGAPLVLDCDFWQPVLTMTLSQCGLSISTGMLAVPAPGADHYLEIAFGSSYQNISLSQINQSPMQFRIHRPDYGPEPFNQDYSYVAADGGPSVPNPHITAYVDGVLAWGTEP